MPAPLWFGCPANASEEGPEGSISRSSQAEVEGEVRQIPNSPTIEAGRFVQRLAEEPGPSFKVADAVVDPTGQCPSPCARATCRKIGRRFPFVPDRSTPLASIVSDRPPVVGLRRPGGLVGLDPVAGGERTHA